MKGIDSSFYIIIVKDGRILVFQIKDQHRCVWQQQQVLCMFINYIKLTELIDYTTSHTHRVRSQMSQCYYVRLRGVTSSRT